MNRGVLVWIGAACVLAVLSAGVTRLVLSLDDEPRARRVRGPGGEWIEPDAPAQVGGAPRPALVPLDAPVRDRREQRLLGRLRSFASGDDENDEGEASPRDGARDDAPSDAGAVVSAASDAGAPDAGAPDAGPPDAGAPDAGGPVQQPRDGGTAFEAGSRPTARLRVVLADENRAWLKLIDVDIRLDGHPLVSRHDEAGLSGGLVFEDARAARFAGSHFVEATLTYRGAGGVFGYLDGYVLRPRAIRDVVLADGLTTVTVRGADRGATWPFEQRSAVVIDAE